MVALADPTPSNSEPVLYQLDVTLCDVSPRIWRRLQVPGNANLGWLHAVIQVAMGWTNSHLHQFTAKQQVFSDPSFEIDSFEDDPEVADERKALLIAVLPSVGDVLEYEYDFGDGWRHSITVENIVLLDANAPTGALCLDGGRACPPDDCGGPHGYEHLVKVLGSPNYTEHQTMKDWLGRLLDPEAFDPSEINTSLGRLKWPKVTEAALRKVLMIRDKARK